MTDEFLMVGEVADRLRVSKMTVYRWIEEGRLPAMQVGKQFRVKVVDLDAMMESAQVVVDRSDPWAFEPPPRPDVD
jgi:excisionase family DNA binding protein